MFWERFYSLCEKKGEKPLQVVKNLNIATGSITKWKNGVIPNGQNLILIANYFKVSIDYLLGQTDYKDDHTKDIATKIFLKILNEKNGKLKLKILLMKIGSLESQADSLIHFFNYLNQFETPQKAFEALPKDNGEDFDIDWDKMWNEEKNKESRILELEELLKELEN